MSVPSTWFPHFLGSVHSHTCRSEMAGESPGGLHVLQAGNLPPDARNVYFKAIMASPIQKCSWFGDC